MYASYVASWLFLAHFTRNFSDPQSRFLPSISYVFPFAEWVAATYASWVASSFFLVHLTRDVSDPLSSLLPSIF